MSQERWEEKNKILRHTMKENRKRFVFFEKKRTPNPCFHFYDLSASGYLPSFEDIRVRVSTLRLPLHLGNKSCIFSQLTQSE